MFGKLQSTKSLNETGIGLGLNICKQIAEACGGSIKYNSSYTQGASFTFSLRAFEGINRFEITEIPDEEDHEQLSSLTEDRSIVQSAMDSFRIEHMTEYVPLTKSNDLSKISFIKQDTTQIDSNNNTRHIKCNCHNLPSILIVEDNVFNIITL